MYRSSQLIASTTAAFSLQSGTRSVLVPFTGAAGIGNALRQADAGSLSLHFEHLSSDAVLPPIDIYLNLQDDDDLRTESYVDTLGLYGLPEGPQDRVIDAGTAFRQVRRQPGWPDKSFRLTLIPNGDWPSGARLTIGRIALYFHQW